MANNNLTDIGLLHDKECERMVLGTLLTERDAFSQIRELIQENSFYDRLNQNIYKAIVAINERGDRADIITVMPELFKLNLSVPPDVLVEIACYHTFDVYQYAARLSDLEKRRKFWEIGQYLITNSSIETEDIVDVLAKTKDELDSIFTESVSHISSLNQAISSLYDDIAKNASGSHLTGNPTGFYQIDDKGGLQKSDLIIVAGETSMGKTSFALSVMLNAAESGAKVAMYSMEMKKEQITARLASVKCGIQANKILYSPLSDLQIQEFGRGVGKLTGLEIFFDDRSTSNIDTILASIRSMKLKYGIDGAIIDYLQILNVNMRGANKEQQMGDVARRLKNLAKELDIWIMALSQLNRDSVNPIPTLNRLRDSGQIGEAADIVILIYRPEYYNNNYPEPFKHINTQGTAMIEVAKGRNIGIMKFICAFDKNTTHFYHTEDIQLIEVADDDPF